MAISVTSVGTNQASATTVTVTTTGAIPAGALIYVGIGDRINSTSARTVTDSGSNTYVSAASAYQNNSSGNGIAQILYVANCAAVSSGGTVTLTLPVSGAGAIGVCYATGIATSSPLDVTGTATGGNSPITGTSPTPSVAGNLVVASWALRNGNATITADANWTNVFGTVQSGGAGGISIASQYYVESGTSTKSFSATSSSNSAWALIFASFKASGGVTTGDFFFMFS